MKPLAATILITFACLSAAAADAPQPWQSVPLRNTGGSAAPGKGVIALEPVAQAAASTASSQGGPGQPSKATATALPGIPAAGDPAPTLSVPAKATAEQLPSGLQPGQPVKTYPTLQAAAKDGVNPLRSIAAPSKPVNAAQTFDMLDPRSYVSALREYLGPNGPMIALGGLLAVLLSVAFILRRGR
jgi:hypothetical protein